jgi:hypothetical protein
MNVTKRAGLRRPCLGHRGRLTSVQVLGHPAARQVDGFQMVIVELEVEQDYLRRAKRHFEE